MAGIIRALVVALVLCIPIPRLWRTTQRLSWAKAVVLGMYLGIVGIVFLAEVPSRILYYVASRSGSWATTHPYLTTFGKPLLGNGIDLIEPKGSGQSVLADMVANGVGFLFFF